MKFERANENYNIMSILYGSHNKNPLQDLNESNLNRIISGHDTNGYAMISAYKDELLDDDGNLLFGQSYIDENNKRTKQLKEDIKNLNYSYVPVYGGYKELESETAGFEKSFIVFPESRDRNIQDFDKFEKDIIGLGDKYGQESVLIKRPNENPKYFMIKSGKFGDEFSSVSINDTAKEFFTALRKYSDMSKKTDSWKGTPKRFTYKYEGYFLNPNAGSVSECSNRHEQGEIFHFEDRSKK